MVDLNTEKYHKDVNYLNNLLNGTENVKQKDTAPEFNEISKTLENQVKEIAKSTFGKNFYNFDALKNHIKSEHERLNPINPNEITKLLNKLHALNQHKETIKQVRTALLKILSTQEHKDLKDEESNNKTILENEENDIKIKAEEVFNRTFSNFESAKKHIIEYNKNNSPQEKKKKHKIRTHFRFSNITDFKNFLEDIKGKKGEEFENILKDKKFGNLNEFETPFYIDISETDIKSKKPIKNIKFSIDTQATALSRKLLNKILEDKQMDDVIFKDKNRTIKDAEDFAKGIENIIEKPSKILDLYDRLEEARKNEERTEHHIDPKYTNAVITHSSYNEKLKSYLEEAKELFNLEGRIELKDVEKQIKTATNQLTIEDLNNCKEHLTKQLENLNSQLLKLGDTEDHESDRHKIDVKLVLLEHKVKLVENHINKTKINLETKRKKLESESPKLNLFQQTRDDQKRDKMLKELKDLVSLEKNMTKKTEIQKNRKKLASKFSVYFEDDAQDDKFKKLLNRMKRKFWAKPINDDDFNAMKNHIDSKKTLDEVRENTQPKLEIPNKKIKSSKAIKP